jgi:hypothetical protein
VHTNGFGRPRGQLDGLSHPHLDRGKEVSMKLSDVDARIPSASVSKAN